MASEGLAVSSLSFLRTNSDGFAVLELGQEVLGALGIEIFKVVVVDGKHGSVDTGTKTLYFGKSKETVLGGLAGMNAKVFLNGSHDGIGAAELAGSGSANLEMVLAHGITVVHGIESSDLVNTHGRHFEELSNVVHDRDGGEAELTLANIQKRHDSALFVVGGILCNDFLSSLHIFGSEFKGN